MTLPPQELRVTAVHMRMCDTSWLDPRRFGEDCWELKKECATLRRECSELPNELLGKADEKLEVHPVCFPELFVCCFGLSGNTLATGLASEYCSYVLFTPICFFLLASIFFVGFVLAFSPFPFSTQLNLFAFRVYIFI